MKYYNLFEKVDSYFEIILIVIELSSDSFNKNINLIEILSLLITKKKRFVQLVYVFSYTLCDI